MNDLRSDLELALAIADLADGITSSRFRAADLRVDRKPDRTPVTDADTAVEDAARDLIAARRPGDDVVGEERGGTDTGVGRCWMLDPIDGTKNFLRGVPAWGSLVALLVDGTPVVGVASCPALGRRWWGATGIGAFAGTPGTPGTRIAVSSVSALDDAYVSTTSLKTWDTYHRLSAYLALVKECWESRAFGDVWQHCLVAEGSIDLAVEPIVNPWDVAPLQVIVEEAGGRFSDLSGARRHDRGNALSSNGLLHDAALGVLRTG